MKIRIDLNSDLIDGEKIAFRSPADCSKVTCLVVHHDNGQNEFTFTDAHGNVATNDKELFVENMIVDIILDVTKGLALVQNSLTTAYLEEELTKNKSAYEIAVDNGFEGTEEEWLDSLKGHSGVYVGPGNMPDDCNVQIDPTGNPITLEDLLDLLSYVRARMTDITLYANAWTGADSLYSQIVPIDGITEYSKVDLLPSVEQLAIFYDKDVTFIPENEDGVLIIYAIGEKPTQDYTMQAHITEVAV